jgi:hypothetical protein
MGWKTLDLWGQSRCRIAKRLQQNQLPKLKTDTLPLNYSPTMAQIVANVNFFNMDETGK